MKQDWQQQVRICKGEILVFRVFCQVTERVAVKTQDLFMEEELSRESEQCIFLFLALFTLGSDGEK